MVTPEVKHAVAGPGDGVRFKLGLQTRQAEACTWHVSSRTLTMKITSGHDGIWSSQQCPAQGAGRRMSSYAVTSRPR